MDIYNLVKELNPNLANALDQMPGREKDQLLAEVMSKVTTSAKVKPWPTEYYHRMNKRKYTPHNDEEHNFVYNDEPRYMLLKGGEGAGKSVAGIIKVLERLKRGMTGIMVSPDLEHFKKSLWPEFLNWVPFYRIIDKHQYRLNASWEPFSSFKLVFMAENGSYPTLICGGAKETEIGGWEGPNLSFVHFDEARRHRTPIALKTFDGRIRIDGPNGETPQMWMTTTPRKHWLFEYFGPINDEEDEDEYINFKRNSYTATILTKENEKNLSAGFAASRADSLTESEKRVLLEAAWEDVDDTEKFINIIWWDACKGDIPPLTPHEPAILALDAAKGGVTNVPDCFAAVLVTRDPSDTANVAVRYMKLWEPPKGGMLSYTPIKEEIRKLLDTYTIIEVAYDPYQLHDMAMTLYRDEKLGFFREFPQNKHRAIADKQLQTLILERRIKHDGDKILRRHIDNADIRKDSTEAVRLIKRTPSGKIDAAVATAMAASRCLHYNLT